MLVIGIAWTYVRDDVLTTVEASCYRMECNSTAQFASKVFMFLLVLSYMMARWSSYTNQRLKSMKPDAKDLALIKREKAFAKLALCVSGSLTVCFTLLIDSGYLSLWL